MDAIELLEDQHRDVEELFAEIEETDDTEEKQALFDELADALAIHATIEERHFYPAVREKRTEDILLESLEEHLAVKRVLADLLDLSPEDRTFDAKVKVLKELVEHHVEEEEKELFPKVRKVLSADELRGVANDMMATASELEDDEAARESVRGQTQQAPTL